jgi:alanine racemase
MNTIVATSLSRAWIEVHLGALLENARQVARLSGTRLLPMVKANGYGLGAIRVARALREVAPWGFGVATAEEGAQLRCAGIVEPIVVFTPLLPTDLAHYLEHRLRPAIGSLDALRAWLAAGSAPFHLEIDTGMSRGGIRWDDEAALAVAAELLAVAPGWEGIFTHFHSADTDSEATSAQWERFRRVVSGMPRRPALVHAANSAAALRGTAFAGDLVRPGIFLYGGEALGPGPAPAPVARRQARVVAVRRLHAGDSASYGAEWTASRPTTIATLAIGYADGLPRALAARGRVELGGRLRPIAGRITMDMTLVSLEDGDTVVEGDVATLYGGLVSVDDQATAAGTISYELLTSLGSRLPRVYRES